MSNSKREPHTDKQRLSTTRIIVLFASLMSAGCASIERAALPVSPPANVAPSDVVAAEPATGAATEQDTAKNPSALPPTKTAAPSAPAPGKKSSVTTSKPAANPPLDLPLLEKRLRETEAIGVFTKIALKNQVDDLLNKFRAYYQGRSRTTLAELRQPYDMLLLKVLSLLQDSDPSLAHAIVASRETIWGMLADPNKFATL